MQEEGESVNQYMARLKTTALDCEFRDLKDALVEQLVCRVRDIRLQGQLLAKKNLDLQTVLEEAQVAEMLDKSIADICKFHAPAGQATYVHLQDVTSDEATDEEADISHLKASTPWNKRLTAKKNNSASCLSCGENYLRPTCRFRSAICHRCGKQGHIAQFCRSFAETASFPKPWHCANEDCFAIFHGCPVTEVITRPVSSEGAKLLLTVNIEGATCQVEVDTGSAKSIVSWSAIKRLIPNLRKIQLCPCPVKLHVYQGNYISIIGHGRFLIEKMGLQGIFP